jgi:hypothetical protein
VSRVALFVLGVGGFLRVQWVLPEGMDQNNTSIVEVLDDVRDIAHHHGDSGWGRRDLLNACT